MIDGDSRILLQGLGLPEAPRWRNGRLYFSDVWAAEVVAVDLHGQRETIVRVPERPNGLGFLPDGRLLIVSTRDRLLLVHDGRTLQVAADLQSYTHDLCNDMVVDRRGRAYVGDFRIAPGSSAAEKLRHALGANLVMVDLSGDTARPTVRVVAEGLLIPNGMVITPDGATLLVAETGACRIAAFELAADGSLHGRRIWAELSIAPDGICLDNDGSLWVATPFAPSRLQRVTVGGRVLGERLIDGGAAFACTLGGADGRMLFSLEATMPTQPTDRLGRIVATRVDAAAGQL
jgi:sugar lactone lactonase YvrE